MFMRNAIKMVGLVFVLALSACGEGGGGGDVGPFVGTWRPTAGAIKRACPGETPTMEALARDLVWSVGNSSDLASITAVSPCRVKADVGDTTAIGVPDDNCRYAERAGTAMLTLSSYTFAIAPDGRSAVERAFGQTTGVEDGVAKSCAFEETGTYAKITD
jgi:hypothetical protein